MIPQASPGSAVAVRRAEYDEAFERVLASGRFILGPEVASFEAELAAHLGLPNAVGVANGTDALELALRAVGIGADDRVYTVSHTAGATVAAILRLGATPVLVDVDERAYTMDPESLRSAIRAHPPTERSAVVPVHLYGAMADMPSIGEIARHEGLAVVEDCAQAIGAAIDGRPAGTWGDAAAFSFYPTKNLGAIGDGGAVVTADPDVAAAVRALRQYGWTTPQVSERLGVNSRLDEVQAAFLRVGLRHLDADNTARAAIAERYDAGLASGPLTLPMRCSGHRHAFHQYVVRTGDRDALRAWCEHHDVGTAVHYPVPVHRQPGYRDHVVVGDRLDITDRLAGELLSLPMFPQLTTDQVDEVVRVVTTWPALVPG
jgi:dTDP-4-amino-4,6-dideoxygalactose transaminase